MSVTIIGDFADPLSFLASQRIGRDALRNRYDFEWLAVEADRGRPLGGEPLSDTVADLASQCGAAGETVPAGGVRVPNSRAATAAYAESLSDGVPDAMRRALFGAVWVRHDNVADPNIIRSLVFDVLHPLPPDGPIDWRIRANEPLVPLGDPDTLATTRKLGLIVSMGRGPLTVAGQRRIDAWRKLWLEHGQPELPLLLTDRGEQFFGRHALAWLEGRLPNPRPTRLAADRAQPRPSEAPRGAIDLAVAGLVRTAY